MTQEHPCTDCPGLPHGCHMSDEGWLCVPHVESDRSRRIKKLTAICIGLSTPRAYALLVQLAGPNEVVWPLRGKPGGLKREQRLKTLVNSDTANWMMAKDVRFKFWGGPPTSLNYYNGTLEDLLIDRLLDSIYSYGLDSAEKWLGEKVCTPL